MKGNLAADHDGTTPYLLTLSAHCESSLKRLAAAYAQRIRAYPDYIGDICRGSRSGKHPERRLAMIFRSREEAIEGLEIFAQYGKLSQGMRRTDVMGVKPVIGYLYTGQGSRSLGMAKEFYERQPAVRNTLSNGDTLLEPVLNVPLVDIIFHSDEAALHSPESAYGNMLKILSELFIMGVNIDFRPLEG